MPRISQFFGIVIAMYYRDHAPPHFHAAYSGFEAAITIAGPHVMEGKLPKRVLSLVVEWARLHRKELLVDWDLARRALPLKSIAPLE